MDDVKKLIYEGKVTRWARARVAVTAAEDQLEAAKAEFRSAVRDLCPVKPGDIVMGVSDNTGKKRLHVVTYVDAPTEFLSEPAWFPHGRRILADGGRGKKVVEIWDYEIVVEGVLFEEHARLVEET